MQKLKACPFCGGTDLNTSHINEIWCKSCDAGVHLGYHGDNTSKFAVDAWNRRPTILDKCKKEAYENCSIMYKEQYDSRYLDAVYWKSIHSLNNKLPNTFLRHILQLYKYRTCNKLDTNSPIYKTSRSGGEHTPLYFRLRMKDMLIEFEKWIENEFG